MKWEYNDGGRSVAGFSSKSDCVCRAIAVAVEIPYQDVCNFIDQQGAKERITRGRKKCGRSSIRTGVYKGSYKKIIASLGWTWTPTMFVGSGCKVHLREGELPMGRLIVSLSRHLVAVVDGVVQDVTDPSRQGTRCVYGYWSKPQPTSKGAKHDQA